MIGALRYVLSGGAPLAVETLREAEAEAAFGVPVREAYGLSESCGPVCFNPMDGPSRPGTVGRPLPGTDAAIADDGEVLLRGGIVMRGYWRNPEATEAAIRDGWFATGDLARVDEDGFYYDVVVDEAGRSTPISWSCRIACATRPSAKPAATPTASA